MYTMYTNASNDSLLTLFYLVCDMKSPPLGTRATPTTLVVRCLWDI